MEEILEYLNKLKKYVTFWGDFVSKTADEDVDLDGKTKPSLAKSVKQISDIKSQTQTIKQQAIEDTTDIKEATRSIKTQAVNDTTSIKNATNVIKNDTRQIYDDTLNVKQQAIDDTTQIKDQAIEAKNEINQLAGQFHVDNLATKDLNNVTLASIDSRGIARKDLSNVTKASIIAKGVVDNALSNVSNGLITSKTSIASTTAAGKIQLATDSEVTTGTNTNHAVSPSSLKHKLDNLDSGGGEVLTFRADPNENTDTVKPVTRVILPGRGKCVFSGSGDYFWNKNRVILVEVPEDKNIIMDLTFYCGGWSNSDYIGFMEISNSGAEIAGYSERGANEMEWRIAMFKDTLQSFYRSASDKFYALPRRYLVPTNNGKFSFYINTMNKQFVHTSISLTGYWILED